LGLLLKRAQKEERHIKKEPLPNASVADTVNR